MAHFAVPPGGGVATCLNKNFSVMNLSESSMNFDLEHVPAFLARVGELVDDGFGRREQAEVLEHIRKLKVDEETELQYTVTHEGEEAPLKIAVFMDDVAAPDIAFFTTAELAGEIDDEFEEFAEEKGL